MAKSAAFGVMHVGISFSIGYALTGSLAVAGAMTLIEPVANTIASSGNSPVANALSTGLSPDA